MSHAIARKYARSLVEVALERGNQERVKADLAGFTRLYQESSELRSVLESPAIPFSSKRGVLAEIAARGQMEKEVANFLNLLLQNNRIQLLPQIPDAFQDVMNEKIGVLSGQVYSSVPLESHHKAAIERRLAGLTGKKVQLDYHRDTSLIGGVKIHLGSVIYDASVQKQLEEIRKQILQG